MFSKICYSKRTLKIIFICREQLLWKNYNCQKNTPQNNILWLLLYSLSLKTHIQATFKVNRKFLHTPTRRGSRKWTKAAFANFEANFASLQRKINVSNRFITTKSTKVQISSLVQIFCCAVLYNRYISSKDMSDDLGAFSIFGGFL